MSTLKNFILVFVSVFLVSCSSLSSNLENSKNQEIEERYYERYDRKW